jgi:hypothetical protein
VVEIRQAGGAVPAGEAWLGERDGLLDLDPARRVRVRRAPGLAVYAGERLAPDDLVHPYLGPVGIAFSRWLGRETFHAGAFVAGGGGWAIVGGREAGKSSLLAALGARDVPVLTDDLLVLEGTKAFAGPRMLDLRTRPDARLAGVTSEPARRGTRWRVRTGDVEPFVSLRGWFFLSWDERIAVERLEAASCLARLACWRGRPELPSDPAALLALSALPCFELRRPRRWDGLAPTLDALWYAIESS